MRRTLVPPEITRMIGQCGLTRHGALRVFAGLHGELSRHFTRFCGLRHPEDDRLFFFFDAFDDYEECAKRLCYYGLFRSANHVYSPKKSYYATRQIYHFVRPGWRRIAAVTEAKGLTLSAFQGPSPDALVVVGVKEGGPNRIRIELPQTAPGPASWDLYETTRELDCQKVETISVLDGHAEIELPAEAVFTLVARSSKSE